MDEEIPPIEETPVPEPQDVQAELDAKVAEAIADMDAAWKERTTTDVDNDDVNATRSMVTYEGVNAEALPQRMVELSVCHGGAPAYRKFSAGKAYRYDDEGNVESLE